MAKEFQKRAQTDNPPRFVLTLGDNIYADVNLGYMQRHSGAQDRDWENKFFEPYRATAGADPVPADAWATTTATRLKTAADLTDVSRQLLLPGEPALALVHVRLRRPGRFFRPGQQREHDLRPSRAGFRARRASSRSGWRR